MPNRQNSIDRLEEFRQITAELDVLKNRVRRIIGKQHFPTDGEWKESIVRTFLRRNMPDNIRIGRGFVITPEGCSSQIDVLIYESDKPVLLREGDLVCVSPDAVRAIIEVKTKLDSSNINSAIQKLSDNIELIRTHRGFRSVAGLISIEDSHLSKGKLADELAVVSGSKPNKVIDFVSIGHDTFARYHNLWRSEEGGNLRKYDKWHIYDITMCAPAYFLINVIDSVCGDSIRTFPELWYPEESEEKYLKGIVSRDGNIEIFD